LVRGIAARLNEPLLTDDERASDRRQGVCLLLQGLPLVFELRFLVCQLALPR
jgi:hypothetical protein